MPTASQTAAGFSFLCLAGAGAWLVMSQFPIADPGRPTTDAAALRILEAAVPAIGDFSAFDVNDENPFIPSSLRKVEKDTKHTPPQPPNRTKPVKAPVVDEPGKPTLPRLPAPGSNGPSATGILLSKDGPQAMLTFPGEKNARVMKPGETVNGWTLMAVEGGNVARVKQDASGAVVNLIIPEDLTPPKKPEPKPEAKGKDAKQPATPGTGKGAKEDKAAQEQDARQPKAPPAPAEDGNPPRQPEPKLPPRPDKLM